VKHNTRAKTTPWTMATTRGLPLGGSLSRIPGVRRTNRIMVYKQVAVLNIFYTNR